MEELKSWLPIIIVIISNVVVIVVAFGKLQEKIAVLGNKFENMAGDIKEIKGNHLVHLQSELSELRNEVNEIDKKLYAHLQQG